MPGQSRAPPALHSAMRTTFVRAGCGVDSRRSETCTCACAVARKHHGENRAMARVSHLRPKILSLHLRPRDRLNAGIHPRHYQMAPTSVSTNSPSQRLLHGPLRSIQPLQHPSGAEAPFLATELSSLPMRWRPARSPAAPPWCRCHGLSPLLRSCLRFEAITCAYKSSTEFGFNSS